MSSTPTDVVKEFFAVMSDGPEGLRQALRHWFTPETIWVNTGLATTVGIEEALALVEQLDRSAGVAAVEINIQAIAAEGAKVLTERLDHMIDASGKRIKSDLVMGILEVEGDRIVAWRDYFDSAAALAPTP